MEGQLLPKRTVQAVHRAGKMGHRGIRGEQRKLIRFEVRNAESESPGIVSCASLCVEFLLLPGLWGANASLLLNFD